MKWTSTEQLLTAPALLKSDQVRAGAVNNCLVLVHFIFWKSKGLTWSDLSKAGAVNNCSVLVHFILWKSKGLTWSDLSKAGSRQTYAFEIQAPNRNLSDS